MQTVHAAASPVTLPVAGTAARYPLRRVYCVGRNYADHIREMGADPARVAPVFFAKPADAVLEDGADFVYPPRSADVQPEVELVVAVGRAGADIAPAQALDHVYGYAVGNDWTRRDLQSRAKRAGEPWDMGKGFDGCASVGLLQPVSRVGHPERGAIRLAVNGELRQTGDLAEMLCGVADLIAELSTYVRLAPGDLIFTGTPKGVAPIQPGDRVECSIAGVGQLMNRVVSSR